MMKKIWLCWQIIKKQKKKKKKKTFGTDTKQIQNISQITNLVPKSYTLKNENFVSSI